MKEKITIVLLAAVLFSGCGKDLWEDYEADDYHHEMTAVTTAPTETTTTTTTTTPPPSEPESAPDPIYEELDTPFEESRTKAIDDKLANGYSLTTYNSVSEQEFTVLYNLSVYEEIYPMQERYYTGGMLYMTAGQGATVQSLPSEMPDAAAMARQYMDLPSDLQAAYLGACKDEKGYFERFTLEDQPETEASLWVRFDGENITSVERHTVSSRPEEVSSEFLITLDLTAPVINLPDLSNLDY